MKPKYKIGDIVMWWDSSIFCEFFPMEVKLVSNRKLGLFWYFYYTRVREWMPDWIHEYRTKRVYERKIEKLVKNG